jgi:DNA-binding IclR family transcriptional regulator
MLLHNPTEAPALPRADLLRRIRGEYRDMPGLQLTSAQAARLLGIDPQECRVLLDHLIQHGVLRRRERGHYVLAEDR